MPESDCEAGAISAWLRIDEALRIALEQPPELRASWVHTSYAQDPTLRDAVLDLLAADAPSEALMKSAVRAWDKVATAALALDSDGEQAGQLVGTRMGAYRLRQLLACGGMGAVYRAERDDGQFQQTVAIKILPGWVTDAHTVARLKVERQILSGLQHPNITRLLGGGETPDGYPYLVTEFIRGEPIDDYVTARKLSVEQRLALLAKVADAVHYAHQNLIVHRDIKPSNILVDADGRPHLLDFGISKLLENEHGLTLAQTAANFVPMTPDWASPEQRGGEDITTASDIYQLGLLLHLLLTGKRPDSGAGIKGAVTRPSTLVTQLGRDSVSIANVDAARLARRLKGDLDVIVLKALREAPEDRYISAAELAADIRRHLHGEAIEARPEPLSSTVRRLRRHYPAATTLSLMLVFVLVAAAAGLYIYAREVERQRDEATRQALRATQVTSVLTELFRRADPIQKDSVGGKTLTVWDSLDAATREARAQLAGEPDIQAELWETLSRLYLTNGQEAKAMALLREAVAMYRALGPTFWPNAMVAQAEYAGLLGRQDSAAAKPLMAEAVAAVTGFARNRPTAAASILMDAGYLYYDFGQFDIALEHFQQGAAIFMASDQLDPSMSIEVLFGEANALRRLGRLEEAEPLLLEALAQGEVKFGPDHRRLAGVISALGNLERQRNNSAVAIKYNLRLVQILERDSAPNNYSLLSARNNLALAYGTAGRWREEQEMHREVITVRRELYGQAGSVDLALSLKNLASSLQRSGDFEEALQVADESRAMMQRHLPPDSLHPAYAWLTTALVYLDSNQAEQAETAIQQSLAVLEPRPDTDHLLLEICHCVLAETYLQLGRTLEAQSLAATALPTLKTAGPGQQYFATRCAGVLND